MIALVTADLSDLGLVDEDRTPLEQAFAGRAPAEFVIWNDPAVDWAAYELVVLRSTWNYIARPAEFVRWVDRVAGCSRLLNPAPTVRWNLDKSYLGALAAAGVPVGETRYLDDLADFDDALDAIEALDARAGAQVVVKPTLSAGSDLTGRFERSDPGGRALAARILGDGRRVMLQPYYESVTERGEIAVVHLGGTFSHAVRKGPLLELGGGLLGGAYTEVIEPVTPPAAVLAAADAVLGRFRDLTATDPDLAATEPLLYSRVDLIEDDDGEPRCLELELIEPSLFFATDAGAADRFVDAVLARLS